MKKSVVELEPRRIQVVRLERALEVTEVGLKALAKQEKGFLSGQVGEACKGRQLCVNLALQEG